MKRLHFVINQLHSKNGIITDVNNAIHAGVKVIHYNEKRLRKRQVVENAYILSALCKKSDVLFIMQDYPDVASLVGADGVHLTQPGFSIPHVRRMLGDEKIIGIDFTTLRDAVNAEDDGVDYLSFNCWSVEFNTSKIITKIQKLKEIITIPIIAMGDFTPSSIETFIEQGIDGIALMSRIQQQDDLYSTVKDVLRMLQTPHSL